MLRGMGSQYKHVQSGTAVACRESQTVSVMSRLHGARTVALDSFGLALAIWSVPAAILLVGTPIVMAVALGIALMRWMVQA